MAPAGAAVGTVREALQAAHERFVLPLIPPGQPLWNAHAHLGRDADGSRLEPDELLAEMARHGVERAFVVPFRAPDRDLYPALNDDLLGRCAATGGRLLPFCRSEPGAGFAAELERALDRGAAGIKLHPTDGVFDLSHPELRAAFALAAERRVPLLLHAGRGLAPLAADLAVLVEEHPQAQVILAHAAIADMHRLFERLAGCPSLVLDTSVWNALDVHALLTLAAPEQLVLGTDAPYYTTAGSLAKLLLALANAGGGPEETAAALWTNASRVAGGRPAERLSPPLRPPARPIPLDLLRAHEYLVMAIPLVWHRQPDLVGLLRLAAQTLRREEDETLAEAALLLGHAEACWREELRSGSREEILSLSWQTFRLVELADSLILGAA
jgi:predicted TIM-barrel fold metal-dependent hydrolase